MIYFFLVFFALTILLQIVFKNKTIHSRWINYFKFLFPSWCFFDESSDTPVLLFKTNLMDNYQLPLVPITVKWQNLFYNPNHNLYMNFHSLQQQLLNDIYDKQNEVDFQLQDLNSYQRGLNYIRYSINKKNYQTLSIKFAFIKKNKDSFDILETIFDVEGIKNVP